MYNYDIFESLMSEKYNPVKIETKDDTSTITIDVPGYKKEEVSITADEKYLSIKLDGKRGKKSYTFKLNDADILNISSKMENGELEVFVPGKKSNKVTIEIK